MFSSKSAPALVLALAACQSGQNSEIDSLEFPARDEEALELGQSSRQSNLPWYLKPDIESTSQALQGVEGVISPAVVGGFPSGEYLILDEADHSLHYYDLERDISGKLISAEREPLIKDSRYFSVVEVYNGNDQLMDSLYIINIGFSGHSQASETNFRFYLAQKIDGKIVVPGPPVDGNTLQGES